MPPDTQKWLDFAREDMQMAELAMRSSLFSQVCFHAHQAADVRRERRGRVVPQKRRGADDPMSFHCAGQ
jgi:hypothetical protein